MRLILFGAPGSGKGTQADLISDFYKIKKIVLGDILREEISKNTELAEEIKKYMFRGLLVPDELVSSVVEKNIDKDGFVLDGYPRNLKQALDLEGIFSNKNISYDAFIYLEIDKETMINRLSKRLICKNCNINYHTENMPPKVDGICDKCKGKLTKRPDDEPDVIEKRFEVFLENSKEVLDFYKNKNKLLTIDARPSSNIVFKNIKESISLLCRR